jgi:type IV pilus assembly protein PilX
MNMHASSSPLGRSLRRGQQGISLLFALMSLVILGFAAVALTRSVDTGTLIMGNIAFKQDAIFASSSGAELAMDWLRTNIGTATLDLDHPDVGYYASSKDKLDVTGNKTSAGNKLAIVNWMGNCGGVDAASYASCDVVPTPTPAVKVNYNDIQWIITRLCDTNGPAAAPNSCVRPATISTSTASERGELSAGGRISATIASPYFRIVVRAEGPRNTVSYTETLVHF